MKKLLSIILIIAIAAGGFVYYRLSGKAVNVDKQVAIYIPHKATHEQVLDSLRPHLKSEKDFILASKVLRLKGVPAGKYMLNVGMSYTNLVNKLKKGKTEIVKLQLNSDIFSMYELSGIMGKTFESDSTTFINYFKELAQEKGYENVEDLKRYFFIDTYHMDWASSPERVFVFFERMYDSYWTDEKRTELRKLGLNEKEIYSLAAIVQKEYGTRDERSTIASLYLNRLKTGMKLQSDPTVIYSANAQNNFTGEKIKRVLFSMLEIDSPNNTYKYAGLPPTPISFVEQSTLESTVKAENTNYIYMCAPTTKGPHLFTDNYQEHLVNAKAYQEWFTNSQK